MSDIVERRYISPETLRSLCIAENWYTKGGNADYANLFRKCRAGSGYAELTTTRIAMLAVDIQSHSDVEHSIEYLLNIMFCIAQASTTYFELAE